MADAVVRNALDLFGDIEPSLSVHWSDIPYAVAERSHLLFAAEVISIIPPAVRSGVVAHV